MTTPRRDWLHTLPPWRFPYPGQHPHRHHRHHLHAGDVFEAVFKGIGWLVILELGTALWIVELEVWLTVWVYYGMFLGARWVYRHNVIGQTVTSLASGRRQKPVERPAGRGGPIDLSQAPYAPWSTPRDPYSGTGTQAPDAGPVTWQTGAPPDGGIRRRQHP